MRIIQATTRFLFNLLLYYGAGFSISLSIHLLGEDKESPEIIVIRGAVFALTAYVINSLAKDFSRG